MNEELRRRYVRDLTLDLEQVGGARLEQWIRPLWDILAGSPVDARGINLEGAPVSGALDAIWPDGSVSEASSDATYFTSSYDKPRHDFRHALEEVPGVRVVRLFSTRVVGPKVGMLAHRMRRRLAHRGFTLDLWDGKRIAEYIVDRLLLDERYIRRVGDALPNLRRIAEQNAASARLPNLDPHYLGRDDEERSILERLRDEKCIVVAGMGGIGKTELACAVAHRVQNDFELVVWADGDRVESLEGLLAFDVRLNGYKLNFFNLLSDSKTLLVLDNTKVDLDQTQLADACGANSRILITSQVEFGSSVYPLGFLGREQARQVISAGMTEKCNDALLDAIMVAVEGHPLVLRLLNGVATRSGWAAVAQHCPHMAGAPDEKRRTVASRILEQHLEVLGPELAFFAWCGTGTVDRGLFEHVFGPPGVEKLVRWSLTARGQSDSVRLHDLVYLSVERIRQSLPIDVDRFETLLGRYIANQLAPKRLGFFRVVNRHRTLLESLLRNHPKPGAIRYAYLHGHLPIHLDPNLIGDPAIDSSGDPGGEPTVWLLSIVEAIEADYRRLRDLGEGVTAKNILESRLLVFEVLISRVELPIDARAIARHHKAKSLLKLGRAEDAMAIFETLINEPAVKYAAKLQLARLSKNDSVRAKELIFEIIEAERAHLGAVATSVLLETLATLRRAHLRRSVPEMTSRFGIFMAQQIKAAACSGEDQPIRAFASVGPEWAYQAPELFLDVLTDIDLGAPSEAEDDDERTAIGRLLTAAGKMYLRRDEAVEARRRFEQSLAFYSSIKRPNAFARTHYADALLCFGRAGDAAQVLDQTPEREREAFWLLRRSEAHLALGELESALHRIDEALGRIDLEERRPTFLALRAEILFAKGDTSHESVLEEAVALCKEGQYRGELQLRLDSRRAISS